MVFGHSESSRSYLKGLGVEFEFSTPALAVFLVGSALFVLPNFLPRAVTPRIGRPTPAVDPRSTDQVISLNLPSDQHQTHFPGIVATIKRLDNGDGLLTLEMELINESTKTPHVMSNISLFNAQLIDEASRVSWSVKHNGGDVLSSSLGDGERAVLWAKFDLGRSRPERLTLDANFLESPWENLEPNWITATSQWSRSPRGAPALSAP